MTRSHIRIHIPIQTYPNTGGSWIPPSYRFLVPPLLLTSSSFPPSFLSSPPAHPPFFPPAHRDGGRGEGVMGGNVGHGVVILGHGGLFWGSLGWVVVFLAPGIDQVCTVRDFYQISLNSDDFWKTTSVTKKLWCRIINFWAISLTIEPWSFLNISAYPELKEDHFGAKKSLKS